MLPLNYKAPWVKAFITKTLKNIILLNFWKKVIRFDLKVNRKRWINWIFDNLIVEKENTHILCHKAAGDSRDN